ncbi:MAG: DUF2271 domain-containing protein, partial [Bacteroidota bacterium]
MLVFACVVSGCEPVPPNEGRFWTGRPEAGIVLDPVTGAGGTPETPEGTGGTDPGLGSGGSTGSGGGGAPATGGAGDSGGSLGSGGSAAGSGGVGGSSGTGGRVATGGSATGGATGSGGSGTLAGGTLKVSVTTKAAGGRYQPDNVGAIWIADSGSKFVKSLYVWAAQRRRELSTWSSATSAAGLANNVVDATTSATMQSHGVRMATWNGTNAAKAVVPDGAYKVCFELRDGNGQNQ